MDPSPAAKAEYNLPGVLHFLQTEWKRFERERNDWILEKAQLQARITTLEGQSKSQDNLKNDMLRRIKMLEFALRQERAKAAGVTLDPKEAENALSATISSTSAASSADAASAPKDQSVNARFAAMPSTSGAGRAVTISTGRLAKSRNILQKYLEEMGHSDDVLFSDVRRKPATSSASSQPIQSFSFNAPASVASPIAAPATPTDDDGATVKLSQPILPANVETIQDDDQSPPPQMQVQSRRSSGRGTSRLLKVIDYQASPEDASDDFVSEQPVVPRTSDAGPPVITASDALGGSVVDVPSDKGEPPVSDAEVRTLHSHWPTLLNLRSFSFFSSFSLATLA